MSKRIIKMELSETGIDDAIRELQSFRSWVETKTEELRRQFATAIGDSASTGFSSAVGNLLYHTERDAAGKLQLVSDGYQPVSVSVTVADSGNTTVILANGTDAVWVEFGTGVYFNGSVGTSPNPWGSTLSFRIGEYGLGNGAYNLWAYRDATGVHYTRGIKAQMPLYLATQNAIKQLDTIVKKVFA